jgi:hypothetical protein
MLLFCCCSLHRDHCHLSQVKELAFVFGAYSSTRHSALQITIPILKYVSGISFKFTTNKRHGALELDAEVVISA